MYTSNKQPNRKSIKNSVTVTPIKGEAVNTQSYPNSRYIDGSVAAAATTSIQQPATSTKNQSMFSTQDSNISYQIVASNDPTLVVANTKIDNTGAVPKGKKAKNSTPRKPPPTIENFWSNILNDVKSIENVDAKHQCLPLARIKKIMKLDENAKMIAAEAPLLFAKACEFFIQELTMRAWIHTEDNKRRTLQRTDIAQAIASYDQFDFLIDIVPREEIRFQPKSQKDERTSQVTSHVFDPTASPPPTQVPATATTVQKADPVEVSSIGTVVTPIELIGATQNTQPQQPQQVQIIQHPAMQPQQMQYFITIPGQQPGQTQIVQQLQLQQPNQLTNSLSPQIAGLNVVSQQQPQQLILTTGPNGQLTATPAPSNNVPQQQILLQNFAQQQQQQQQAQQQQMQQQQQPIQILQQVIGPNGEITNVPITISANQLSMLRLQQQQQQQHQHQQQQQNSQAQQQLPQQVNIVFNPTQTTTATVAQLPTHNTSNTITSYRPNC